MPGVIYDRIVAAKMNIKVYKRLQEVIKVVWFGDTGTDQTTRDRTGDARVKDV